MRLPSKFSGGYGVQAGRHSDSAYGWLDGWWTAMFWKKRCRFTLWCCGSFFSVVTPQAIGNELLLERAWQDLQQLSSDEMAGRFPGSVGHQKAQQYIIKRFTELRLQPLLADYRQPFQFQSGFFSQSQGANLVAQLTGCTYPQAYIVITAHYDHLAMAGSKVFNGADDNASGVAGLLYLAGKLNQSCPAYSYLLIATDAEEHGLDGAKAWLGNSPVPVAQQLLNINLDMISRGEKRQRLYLAGKRSLPALSSIPTRHHDKVKLVLGHDGRSRVGSATQSSGQVDWSNASDHAEFRRAGLPYMYFGVDVHRHYHTADDDWEHIDPEFFKSALQLIDSSVQWVEQQSPDVFIEARRSN